MNTFAVEVARRTLFDGTTLRIGAVDTRPTSDACDDVEWQSTNVVVLPFSGVFAKHDGPGRHVIATPTHGAGLRLADQRHRVISLPG